MKLAVLSDIHGNVPALAAVLDDLERWRPDRVVVNGDLVSRGPCSLDALRLLQRLSPDACLLRGNHEHFVLQCAQRPGEASHPLQGFAHWTCRQLGAAVEELRHWDDAFDWSGLEGGSSVHVTHGSRLGNRDGLKPETDDAALREKLGSARDLFVGSHTHRPMIRALDGTLVVNTGSVGQPFDGDPRASYARCSFVGGSWQVEIARVRYDKERAQQDFIDSGFVDQCGPLARLILMEHRHNRMLVGTWMGRYGEAVAAGMEDAGRAVDEYLRDVGLA